jgi:Mn-dependent DtxR family transcriptional regulator
MNTLEVIKEFEKRHGYPPNKSDLAEILDVSISTVVARLNRLVKEGKIKKVEKPIPGNYEVL